MNSFVIQIKKSLQLPIVPGAIITVLIFYLDGLQFALVDKFLLFAAFIIAPLVLLILSPDAKNKQQSMIFTVIKEASFPRGAAYLGLRSQQ